MTRAVADFRVRPGQQALAASIARAIESRGVLVAEAGTGTGKTFAYLVPVLLAGGKALVSTGTRHLQDQLHARDLPAVGQALGTGVRTALLKGRANYVCHFHLRRHLADGRFADPATPARLRRIEQFAATSASGDRAELGELAEDDPAWALATSTRENCLGQDCPDVRRCHVLRARREAVAADVVVVNHHLFCADLALRDEALAELLPTADVVVFDEAHQLPEVATEFFGESVSTRQVVELARDLLRAGLVEAADGADWRALAARLERSARELRLAFGERAGGRGLVQRIAVEQLRAMGVLHEAIDEVAADLASFGAIAALNAGRSLELDRCGHRAAEQADRLRRWRDAVFGPAPDPAGVEPVPDPHGVEAVPDSGGVEPAPAREADPAVAWAEVGAQYASLRRTPLSVAAAFTRHRTGPPRAWVFVSATLSLGDDFSHFVDALGLGDARCERWDSPFDFRRQAALWIPRDVGDAGSVQFPTRMVDAVWPLLVANAGRAFVLCTTLRSMREAGQRLVELDRSHRTGLTVLVQGDAPRHELLRRFRDAPAPVLVGSAGFWEGVDVTGDALSIVVIDKLPFAPPDDPVIKARCDAMRRAGRDPFSEFQLPAAALALKQGAGRLIRSETDRGVLVVCDQRLASRSYGRRLLNSLPPFARVESAEQALGYLPGAARPG